MTTQIKPKSSGSFAPVVLDAAGRVALATDTTITGLDPRQAVLAAQAANEWHNQPNNTAATTAAQKRASAAGAALQEV